MEKLEAISPLRYPGGKKYLAPYIENFLKENLYLGCTFYEPYAGGASISLYLLKQRIISKAVLIEKDPLVYSFWKAAVFYSKEFAARIRELEVSMDTWHRLRPFIESDPRKFSCIDLGLACLFYNRSNYSGILKAGPIGGFKQTSQYKVNCRFNKERLASIVEWVGSQKGKIKIVKGDAIQYLKKYQTKIVTDGGFVYIDPPYFLNGKRLYRFFYKYHEHKKLAEFLNNQKFGFIVSYDNSSEIKKLFYSQKIVPIFLNHAITRSYKVKELLISNLNLPKPQYLGSAKVLENIAPNQPSKAKVAVEF